MGLVTATKKTKYGQSITRLENSCINSIKALQRDFAEYTEMIADATNDINFTVEEVDEIKTSLDNTHKLLIDSAVYGIPEKIWTEKGITLPPPDYS